jgi:hypothetical protein
VSAREKLSKAQIAYQNVLVKPNTIQSCCYKQVQPGNEPTFSGVRCTEMHTVAARKKASALSVEKERHSNIKEYLAENA